MDIVEKKRQKKFAFVKKNCVHYPIKKSFAQGIAESFVFTYGKEFLAI